MAVNWIGYILGFLLVTLWHEAGHLCAAKLLGIPVRRINFGFGPTLLRLNGSHTTELVLRALPMGMSVAVPGRRDEAGQLRRPISHDLWMAAGGPLASFLLPVMLLCVAMFANVSPATLDWMGQLSALSVMVALLNLLPIPGLDGGHLMVLGLARQGWQLSPQREVGLHKAGFTFMLAACGIALVIHAWQWFVV